MFKISFRFLDKNFTAMVQKINQQPVQFIVFDISPGIKDIPDKLVFLSNPVKDQLVYQSFDARQSGLIKIIGEKIFLGCQQQRINVHA